MYFIIFLLFWKLVIHAWWLGWLPITECKLFIRPEAQSPLAEGFASALDVKVFSEIIQQSVSFSIKWWYIMCG